MFPGIYFKHVIGHVRPYLLAAILTYEQAHLFAEVILGKSFVPFGAYKSARQARQARHHLKMFAEATETCIDTQRLLADKMLYLKGRQRKTHL